GAVLGLKEHEHRCRNGVRHQGLELRYFNDGVHDPLSTSTIGPYGFGRLHDLRRRQGFRELAIGPGLGGVEKLVEGVTVTDDRAAVFKQSLVAPALRDTAIVA